MRPPTRTRQRSHRVERQGQRAKRRWRLPHHWVVLGGFVTVLVIAFVAFAGQGGGAIAVLPMTDDHVLAFSPNDVDGVLFAHHNGVMRSVDGGRTWTRLATLPGFEAAGLIVSQADSRQVLVAGHNVFQRSPDHGVSWQPMVHNLPSTDIHGLAADPTVLGHLYAYVIDHGLFRSGDGGHTWTAVSNQLPADVLLLVVAGDEPATLYAVSQREGVLRSLDGGRSWRVAMNGLSDRKVRALAVDPADSRTLFAGLDIGLAKSTDGGASWRRSGFPRANVVSLAASPTRPGRWLALVAVGDQGLLFRSEDGGASWGSLW